MADANADVLSRLVNQQELMRHTQEFTKRIKLSGTPPELESFQYLRGQMADLGFRVSLLSHDAYISLPGPSRVEIEGQVLESITHSYSRPSPAGGLASEVVYLGAGKEPDFAGTDVRGKIVLVEGIASPDVAARASAAGAAGQLHISPNDNRYEMCVSPVWGSPSERDVDKLPKTVVCTINNPDGEELKKRLHAGPVRAVLHAEVDTGWRKTPLLVADLDPPNGTPDAPFVLFSGHHDTWHYGVMDNGTANATMLEASRVLAQHRADWQRGLRVCFWSGHSHGRYSGSAWYVDENWAELDRRCVAHVNVDSTGGMGANELTASSVNAELAALAKQAVLAESGQVHQGKRSSRSSDASFWGVGIPSMFGSVSHQSAEPGRMRNALGWWWHTPHDLLDKIDPANLVRDTRIVVRALSRLLFDPVLPLDYSAHAAALLAELDKLAGPISHVIDLDDLRTEATVLRDHAAGLAGVDPARANAALMRVSRALVPMDYTEGDRFVHDPALPQPPWPVLQPLRDLAAGAGDAAHSLFLLVGARRARNRMLHALREANAALADVRAA